MPDGLSTFLPIIQKAKSTSHFAAAIKSQDADVVDECAVPKFGNLVASFELPEYPRSELRTVVGEFKTLCRTLPGKLTMQTTISQQQAHLSESHHVTFLNSIALK